MLNPCFSLIDKSLEVFVSSDGDFQWTGKYENMKIHKVFIFSDNNTCVLLIDYEEKKGKKFHNLFCINDKGDKLWIAELPDAYDVYVNANLFEENIFANTWSGFGVCINRKDGRTMKTIFSK